jgi:hypothetical protein
MSDFTIIKKVFIGLFLFDIIGFLLISSVGGNMINASQTANLNAKIAGITTAIKNITTFTNLVSYIKPVGFWAGLEDIVNFFIGFINIVADLIIAIVNILVLIGDIIDLLFYIMFTYLPSILSVIQSQLSGVGVIVTDGFVFITVLVALYVIYAVFNMLKGIV